MHLSRVVGDNLKRLRTEQSLSLEALAQSSGVSKSRLGQIERGEANPSIATVWQIATALKVEFSALVTLPQPDSLVVTVADVEPLTADSGRCRTYALFPFDPSLGFEVYLTQIDAGGHLHAEPHPDATRETILVTSGTLELVAGGERHTLHAGEAIRFRADTTHDYRNPGTEPAVFHMTVGYPRT